MTNNPSDHLQFLQEKISDLKSALFFCESNNIFTIPVFIIAVLQVDEEGQIWFCINPPAAYSDDSEGEFPARLDFYRKGKNYTLKITGMACIDTATEKYKSLVGITDDEKKNNCPVLVKVKIINAEYFEIKPQKKGYWWHAVSQKIYNWFFAIDPSYKHYDFGGRGNFATA